MKSPVDCVCKTCSITFQISSWDKRYGRGVYCSRACSQAGMKGDNNPSWKGGGGQKAADARYYAKHPERVRASCKRYATEHPECSRVASARYRTQYPERIQATRKVYVALQRGMSLRRPKVCSKCGVKKPLDGHHEDYSKPLEVIWLCRKCHKARHAEIAQERITREMPRP